MLRMDTDTVLEDVVAERPDGSVAFAASAPIAVARTIPSTYRPSRQFDWAAGLLSAATVAAMLSGFIWMRVAPTLRDRHDLMVLDLRVAPPPATHIVPRPQPHVEPPKAQPIAVPPPIVAVPAPSPVVTVQNVAPPPPVVTAPPMPPAAPVAAAPSPVSAQPADAGDLSSKMISAKPPAYPLDSRRRKEEGTVVLTVLLDTQGRVSDVAIAQSSGSDRLDHAALTAVKDWRWSPVMKNGAPVMVQGRVKIPFILKH
jgi:periplasmic protein TonB